MLKLLGYDITGVLALPADPHAGANILTLARAADVVPTTVETLTAGHKYAFLQRVVLPERRSHWVAIDWTGAHPKVMDAKDTHARECVQPQHAETLADFSQSSAGILFRLDPPGTDTCCPALPFHATPLVMNCHFTCARRRHRRDIPSCFPFS